MKSDGDLGLMELEKSFVVKERYYNMRAYMILY